MPNWCDNTVDFTGNAEALTRLKDLFETLAQKEAIEEQGQLPSFIQADRGYMFSIHCDEYFITYDTKWSPNCEVIKAIADQFKVDYTHSFNELGSLIYGEAIYKNGILTEYWLDSADFDFYTNAEDSDKWVFEGGEYDNEYDILSILLERKKHQA